MKKFLWVVGLIGLCTGHVLAQKDPVLRLSKIGHVKLPALTRQINDFIFRSIHPHLYRLKINTQHPLGPLEAQEVARHLLQDASLHTPLLVHPPRIEPLEQNIHRFVFTISPAAQPNKIAGTGFVFANSEGSDLRLWGTTTADIAQQTGPDILVTFHTHEPHTFSFPARIVLRGNPGGINAALIELPQEVSVVALPIELSPNPFPHREIPLLTYGFRPSGGFYKKSLSLQFCGTERLIAQSPRPVSATTGNGGLVVNEKGQALGIYHAAFRPGKTGENLPLQPERKLQNASYLSAFSPVSHIAHLLKEYRQPHSAARVVLFDGVEVGKLEIDEAIDYMKVYYKNQPPRVLSSNPFWTLTSLSEFVPDLHRMSRVEIHVSGGKQGAFYFEVNLSKRLVLKIVPPNEATLPSF